MFFLKFFHKSYWFKNINRLLFLNLVIFRKFISAFFMILGQLPLINKIVVDCKKNRRVRLYLKKGILLQDFFDELKAKNVNYIVLRWFDNLPNVDVNEDIDILVDDHDIDFLLEYLTTFSKLGSQKFDIYPKSYHQTLNYHGVSYVDKNLAGILLSDAYYLEHNNVRVSKHENNAYSLLYHILWHKGVSSGFNIDSPYIYNNDHDYKSILKLDYNIHIDNLYDIFYLLEDKSYNPPIDTMKKYASISNQDELRTLVNTVEKKFTVESEDDDLILLVLRDRLFSQKKFVDTLYGLIYKFGFDILLTEDTITNNFVTTARGGNWNKGPFPNSGGEPKRLVLVYKKHPKFGLNKDGFSQDLDVIGLKEALRDYTFSSLLYFNHFNGLHTTDNFYETLEYLTYIDERLYENALIQLKSKRLEYTLPSDICITKNLSAHARRAFVYKCLYNDTPVIVKLYKKKYIRYMDREIDFLKDATINKLPVPKVIDRGINYIVEEFIDGDIVNFKPFCYTDENIRIENSYNNFIKMTKDIGYFNCDFIYDNVFQVDNSYIFFDFEFAYRYKSIPETAYEFSGVPTNILKKLDMPIGYNSDLKIFKLHRLIRNVYGK